MRGGEDGAATRVDEGKKALPGPLRGVGAGGLSLDAALRALRERIPEPPEILLVLGSGLGEMVEVVRDAVTVGFSEIPGFPEAGVAGHQGRFVAGRVEGRWVLVQQGRFHFYEGHPPEVVTAPVCLAAQLGVTGAIFTNAAGGLAPELGPGSILLLDDHLDLMGCHGHHHLNLMGRHGDHHLNLMGCHGHHQFNRSRRHPLPGPVQEGGEQLSDMRAPYDFRLQELALEVALEMRIPLSRGIYAGVSGPSYETRAEVRAIRAAGAHAVGMSTVPEVTMARALGLRVLAFSLITNRAAGLGVGLLDHQEVLDVGKAAGGRLQALVQAILAGWPGGDRPSGPFG